MNNFITNPILPGFNPDPSILRVGEDFYIATSTFEWFPGVQIHHSRDLIHWQLIARPLNSVSHLDMRGNPCSGGVWAPCLSYSEGVFYLIYTDAKSVDGWGFKDTHNYLVTATDLTGKWSEPIYLNSSGFDPSLFHDDDGRKWLVNMLWDYRSVRNLFAGIVLQEYSMKEKKLVGNPVNIFMGSELGITEGPHLYKHNGYYYLMTAEGGTGLHHAVTMARSINIEGPYELDPANPILTSRHDPTLLLQKAGHASLVDTPSGEWYIVHLCGRPIPATGRCILGRETAIQKMIWTEEGWFRLEHGGREPQVKVQAPALSEHKWEPSATRDHFASVKLDMQFATLRIPLGEDMMSLKERPGYLRLKGKESLISTHRQSLVARRQQAFRYTASTFMEFEPDNFQQMAGLVCYYNRQNFYYLRVSHDEHLGKCLGIISAQNMAFNLPIPDIGIDGWKHIFLRAAIDYDQLQFYYAKNEEDWIPIGPVMDASTLSDEFCDGMTFTGAFVGLCCQDMSGGGKHADFDWFEYVEYE
ncbi:glycoside hydrolase family 43 protein [Paenibacillus graminis]|uniref:Beta-xylosidase n=1 Tax=Paenibacillus graminis TaxID=189425 RepID=A0A089MAK8_9BACL|nr:glycoside hydrolase family 43 protein [Paenibacillus graminis]AIQ70317.1 beta-xylosidase [Paenibacillus graminis]